MIVWCMLWVALSSECDNTRCISRETAVKGIVLNQDETRYAVNFSKYAKQQGYAEGLALVLVDKYKCIQDE